jgi:hypothetical protein
MRTLIQYKFKFLCSFNPLISLFNFKTQCPNKFPTYWALRKIFRIYSNNYFAFFKSHQLISKPFLLLYLISTVKIIFHLKTLWLLYKNQYFAHGQVLVQLSTRKTWMKTWKLYNGKWVKRKSLARNLTKILLC